MRKRIVAFAVVITVLAVTAPASALAAGRQAVVAGQRSGVSAIHTDVTCHDPCDDPFQLKARVRGSNVDGLRVTFTVKGRTFTARCSSSGRAHYHLDINPSRYPHGVVVKVKASVSHGGVTRTASTWFKPNYN
jgi:hypothetical protein